MKQNKNRMQPKEKSEPTSMEDNYIEQPDSIPLHSGNDKNGNSGNGDYHSGKGKSIGNGNGNGAGSNAGNSNGSGRSNGSGNGGNGSATSAAVNAPRHGKNGKNNKNGKNSKHNNNGNNGNGNANNVAGAGTGVVYINGQDSRGHVATAKATDVGAAVGAAQGNGNDFGDFDDQVISVEQIQTTEYAGNGATEPPATTTTTVATTTTTQAPSK